MAWRNIWRNSRRSLIILAAIISGVGSMIFLNAFTRGMIISIIDNGIKTLTGHVQVHATGYRDDPVAMHSLYDLDRLRETLDQELPPGSSWCERVHVNAVANTARHSVGLSLVGIDPEREPRVSFIGPDAVVDGRFLETGDSTSVVVGQALLDLLDVHLGNKLVLMAMGTDGSAASRAFRIVGAYRSEMEATEKQLVFVPLAAAQQMLGLGNGVSEVAILLPKHELSRAVAGQIEAGLPDGMEVRTWRELLPVQEATLDLFDKFMVLWDMVVFIAMGFGIVNTLLMAVLERVRELGVMRALGMRPAGVVRNVLIEAFILLVLGSAIGNLAGWLSVLPMMGSGLDLSAFAAGMQDAGISRIVYPVISSDDLALVNAVVLVLGLVVSLYPAVKAARFTPVEAMART
jgi:ABC-type lipoprotein release transport system permease subunit